MIGFFAIIAGITAGATTILSLWGGNIFEGLYNLYSNCVSCKYIASLIDFTVMSSNSIYRQFSDYIMLLIPTILVGYLIYRVMELFLTRKTGEIDIPKFYDIFAPKVIAMAFAFILLSQPTPKLMFDYIINPAVAVSSGIGVKLLEVGGGKEVSSSYTKCLSNKDIGIGQYRAAEDNYFKSSKKNLICMAKVSEEVNAVGIVIGNIIFAHSIDARYNWLFLIPNLGMVLTGALLTGLYFVSSFTFTFALLEIFLSLYLVFALFPLAMMSWVLSRGNEPIPRIAGFHEEIIKLLTEKLMTLMTVCFFLGVAILLSSSAWSSNLGGNAFTLIKQAIQNQDTAYIIENVYFGSKSFFYLLITPFFMIFFIMQGRKLGVELGGKLNKGFQNITGQAYGKAKDWTKWMTTKDEAGKNGYTKLKEKVRGGYQDTKKFLTGGKTVRKEFYKNWSDKFKAKGGWKSLGKNAGKSAWGGIKRIWNVF